MREVLRLWRYFNIYEDSVYVSARNVVGFWQQPPHVLQQRQPYLAVLGLSQFRQRFPKLPKDRFNFIFSHNDQLSKHETSAAYILGNPWGSGPPMKPDGMRRPVSDGMLYAPKLSTCSKHKR
jgi:hypothetical protein